jgi:hypothetical protein
MARRESAAMTAPTVTAAETVGNPCEEPNHSQAVTRRLREKAAAGLTIIAEYEPDHARCVAALMLVLSGSTYMGKGGGPT